MSRVDRLRGLRDRAPDAPRHAVRRDRERAALRAAPRSGTTRGTSAAARPAHPGRREDQVDQPRLEEQRGLAGRPFDRRSQTRLLHRSEEEEAPLDEAGEVRVRRHIGQVVGPQRDDQRSPTGVVDQFGEERSACRVRPSVPPRTGRRRAPVVRPPAADAVRPPRGWPPPGVMITTRSLAAATTQRGRPGPTRTCPNRTGPRLPARRPR